MLENWWMIIIVLGLLIAMGIFFSIKYMKKGKHKPDYYSFFMIGIIWIGVGIPLDNVALWTLGIVFFLVGILNREKWKTNRAKWKDLDKKEKKLRIWIMYVLGSLVLLGLVVFLIISFR